MDLTAIARYCRVLAPPLFMLGIAVFFYMLAGDSESGFAVAAVTDSLLMPVAKVFGGFGALWLAWSGYRLHRWESGDRTGDCTNCGAHMSQLDGRYGPYRKCRYCGKKQQGW